MDTDNERAGTHQDHHTANIPTALDAHGPAAAAPHGLGHRQASSHQPLPTQQLGSHEPGMQHVAARPPAPADGALLVMAAGGQEGFPLQRLDATQPIAGADMEMEMAGGAEPQHLQAGGPPGWGHAAVGAGADAAPSQRWGPGPTQQALPPAPQLPSAADAPAAAAAARGQRTGMHAVAATWSLGAPLVPTQVLGLDGDSPAGQAGVQGRHGHGQREDVPLLATMPLMGGSLFPATLRLMGSPQLFSATVPLDGAVEHDAQASPDTGRNAGSTDGSLPDTVVSSSLSAVCLPGTHAVIDRQLQRVPPAPSSSP